MKSTYRILFLIRKKKLNKDGLTNIMVRVTIGGEKAEFSSLVFVKPETWSSLGKEIRKTTVMSLCNVKVEQKRNLVGKTIRNTTLS